MKRINLLSYLLEFLTWLLVFVSIVFLISSFIESRCIFQHNDDFFSNVYFILKKYAGLYYATIILIGGYSTLRQIKISLQNNTTLIEQLSLTEKDLEMKEDMKKKEDTINQTQYFLENIQKSIKDLVTNSKIDFLPTKYKIDDFFADELKKNHAGFYKFLEKTDSDFKAEIVLTLNKIESFASYFLYGNADIELGGKIIGNLYCLQIEYLTGMISFFRNRDQVEPFFNGMIELYYQWKK